MNSLTSILLYGKNNNFGILRAFIRQRFEALPYASLGMTHPPCIPGSGRPCLGRSRGRQPDGEDRALARLARRLDVATHQAGKPPADRKPQPRAAVPALARNTGLAEIH